MDLTTITAIRRPQTRADLTLNPGDGYLGGGSWLYSEPQLQLTSLIDLTTLGWAPIQYTSDSLSIAATCTLAQLAAISGEEGWLSHHLIDRCCEALLGSFKVHNVATVGGNICLGLPAGPMTSLMCALDAVGTIWMPDGGDRRLPISQLVIGVQQSALRPGEVLRSIEIPLTSLRAPSGFRRIALSPLGRTGTLVIARLEANELVVTVTGATERPVQLRYGGIPTASELTVDVGDIDCWYDDVNGAPDWRRAMSMLFAEQLREELA